MLRYTCATYNQQNIESALLDLKEKTLLQLTICPPNWIKVNILQFFKSVYSGDLNLHGLPERIGKREMRAHSLSVQKSIKIDHACVLRNDSLRQNILQLTRVGIGVAVSFGPLIGGGLLVEVVLRLHQRERLCEEGATAYRLVVPQTAVTAALLGAIRQVKRDAPLRLEPRAQNRASDVSALLCPLNFFVCCSD